MVESCGEMYTFNKCFLISTRFELLDGIIAFFLVASGSLDYRMKVDGFR